MIRLLVILTLALALVAGASAIGTLDAQAINDDPGGYSQQAFCDWVAGRYGCYFPPTGTWYWCPADDPDCSQWRF